MKQSIWKVAPFGNFAFKTSDAGMDLFQEEPDTTRLGAQIKDHFGIDTPTAIENITRFVQSDLTDFHTGHLKKLTLKPMEQNGELEILESNRKRRFSYTDGTILIFKDVGR